jgi:hypothetical protein
MTLGRTAEIQSSLTKRAMVALSIALALSLGPLLEQPALGSNDSTAGHSVIAQARFCGATPPVIEPSGAPWKCLNHAGIYDIRWTSWTERSAKGQGIVEIDPCVPDCVSDTRWGHFPAQLTLTSVKTANGQTLYSKMAVHFTRQVPHGYRRDMTVSLVT